MPDEIHTNPDEKTVRPAHKPLTLVGILFAFFDFFSFVYFFGFFVFMPFCLAMGRYSPIYTWIDKYINLGFFIVINFTLVMFSAIWYFSRSATKKLNALMLKLNETAFLKYYSRWAIPLAFLTGFLFRR